MQTINLLLVEDSLVYTKYIKVLFDSCGKHTFKVNSVDKFCEISPEITSGRYDVLLLDLGLDDTNGINTLQKVIDSKYNLPVVVLTAAKDLDLEKNAILLGADDFLVKERIDVNILTSCLIHTIERFKLRQVLERKEMELQRMNKNLNALIYKISHDLKGPITSISGLAKLAKMEIQDTKALTYFEHVDLNSKSLLARLRKLIDVGSTNEVIGPLSLIYFKSLCEEILFSLKYVDGFSDIKIDLNINEGQKFYSDRNAFISIFQELIENAIQFRNKDIDAIININVQDRPKGLLIVVEDNGIGIPVEIQGEVFDIFVRGTEVSKGAGIGLYLVKSFVEKFEGTIKIKSFPNGTRIEVFFPYSDYFLISEDIK
jgi:two-component system sensor histidine kinase/response regulator